jgi:hypothetical protein
MRNAITVLAAATVGLVPVVLEAAPVSITECRTINSPGSYVVANNLPGANGLLAGGNCLVIGSSGRVTINLNGFQLTGVGTGTGVSQGGSGAIEVRNGIVRGFASGISLNNASGPGNVIEGVRAFANTNTGIRGGKGSIVSKNVLVGNGVGIGVSCPALIWANIATGNGSGPSFDMQLISGLESECRFTDNVVSNGPDLRDNHP